MATWAEYQRHQVRMQQRHMPQRPHARHGGHHQQNNPYIAPPIESVTGADMYNDPGLAYYDDLFVYGAPFGNLVAGASQTVSFNIQIDSSFDWMKTSVFGNLHGATEPWSSGILLPLNLTINDTGSAVQLMNVPIPVSLIAGDGKLPFINPVPRIFKPAATVQLTLANYSTSQYDNLFVAMIGRKIFKGGPPSE